MEISTKEELKECLKIELSYYGKGDIRYFLQSGEKAILRRHQLLLRKAEYHVNNGHKVRGAFFKFRLSKIQNKYAMHIPLNSCGKGLKIMHVGPILLNSKARLGENCALHINTGIVAGGVDNCAPALGNGVVVGFGAVVLGGVRLADNIAVGANAVVTKSFEEENIAIAGAPAKKVSDRGRLEWNRK